MSFGQLQQAMSNVCGLYCAYYVMKRHQGKTMKDIVKDFNTRQKKRNDRLIVTKNDDIVKTKTSSIIKRDICMTLCIAFSSIATTTIVCK